MITTALQHLYKRRRMMKERKKEKEVKYKDYYKKEGGGAYLGKGNECMAYMADVINTISRRRSDQGT